MAVFVKRYRVRHNGVSYGPGQPGGQIIKGLSEEEEAHLIGQSDGYIEKCGPPESSVTETDRTIIDIDSGVIKKIERQNTGGETAVNVNAKTGEENHTGQDDGPGIIDLNPDDLIQPVIPVKKTGSSPSSKARAKTRAGTKNKNKGR